MALLAAALVCILTWQPWLVDDAFRHSLHTVHIPASTLTEAVDWPARFPEERAEDANAKGTGGLGRCQPRHRHRCVIRRGKEPVPVPVPPFPQRPKAFRLEFPSPTYVEPSRSFDQSIQVNFIAIHVPIASQRSQARPGSKPIVCNARDAHSGPDLARRAARGDVCTGCARHYDTIAR